jgi:hypothetical protein
MLHIFIFLKKCNKGIGKGMFEVSSTAAVVWTDWFKGC